MYACKMLKYNVLLRKVSCTSNQGLRALHKSLPIWDKKDSSSSSSSNSSSDDDSSKEKDAKKSSDVLDKLNLLLKQMIQEDFSNNEKPKLDLAKPKNVRRKDTRTEPGTSSVESEPVEKKLVTAVKDVAKSIGGDVKQIESELLSKLLNPVNKSAEPASTTNLSDIVKGMKIDREPRVIEQASRAQQVRQILHANKGRQQQFRPTQSSNEQRTRRKEANRPLRESNIQPERVNLFGSEPLHIFAPPKEGESSRPEEELNKTWTFLHERELRLAVTHPPANYFQQMILWTEQEKTWKFPIDNEQGMEEELNTYFTEHVFLEKHLEPWCPQKGPIRHFMELVCVGLSKNHYLSVQHKKEHIEWYKDYFEEKKKLLLEVGAFPPVEDASKQSTKSIEK